MLSNERGRSIPLLHGHFGGTQVLHQLLHPFALVAGGIPDHGDREAGLFSAERAVDTPVAEIEAASHFRDHGDAVAEGDEFLHCRELTDAIHRDGLDGLLAAIGSDVVREAVCLVQHHERVFFDGIGSDLLAGGERMRNGEDEEQLFFKKSFGFQVPGDEGQGEDGDVNVAVTAAFKETSG